VIYSFEQLPSTQIYLVEKIREGALVPPVAVIAARQEGGVGSRGNSWSGGEGNFFASFALDLDSLPEDLSLGSASIYFAYIMKKILLIENPEVWLKWPNDLYLGDDKIGGVITQVVGKTAVCGIGINLGNTEDGYCSLRCASTPRDLLENYLFDLEKFPKWKEIFSEYQIEFERSKVFSVHIKNYQQSLQNALLCEDGSLLIEGKRVFSLR